MEMILMKYQTAKIGKMLFGALVPFLVYRYLFADKALLSSIIKVSLALLFTLAFWVYEKRQRVKSRLN